MTEYQFLKNTLISNMNTLSRILEKGEQLVVEKGMTENEVLEGRLAPDMLPFVAQIRMATDNARRCLFLLAGKEHVKMEDNETTFTELKERVSKTKELLASISDDDFTGADERKIQLSWMGESYVLGKDFVVEFPVQNTFFHVVTAYGIIRHLGGAIGKTDYIGNLSLRKD